MVASEKTLDLIESLRSGRQTFCIATVLRTADSTSARAGAKAVITPNGDLHGFIGGSCITGAVRRAALEALENGEPHMIRVKPKNKVTRQTDSDGVRLHKSSCPSGGTVDIFLEPMKTARKLLICGASPIAQAILTIAKSIDVQTIVAAQPADHDSMVGADDYLMDFDISSIALSSNDAVIVATQGKRDMDALNSALKSSAGYMGMVCSRKKLARLKEDLIAGDNSLINSFEQLHAPAGLNIGAIEPEEIGLAVVCEIVAKWRHTHTSADDLADYSTEMVL